MPLAPTPTTPVFCSIVDSAYFLGGVALVNSLRLTGHTGDIVFLDVGLDPDQRAFLEREATILPGPPDVGWLSVFAKPKLGLLVPDRTAIILDNDLVITGSFEPLIRAAHEGAIAVFEQPDATRRFPEWEQLFALREPLRSGKYVNGACIVLSTGRWRHFLERWQELGEVVAAARADRPFLLRTDEVVADPMGYNEQDTLNALLMSEVPDSAMSYWPHDLTPWWEERGEVRVLDTSTLRCEKNGGQPLFLHGTGQPKSWQRWGWLKLRFSAFNQLLTRVLAGEDVALRVPMEDIPIWLRPGLRGRALEYSGAAAAKVAYGSLALLPDGVKTRVTGASRARLSGTGSRA